MNPDGTNLANLTNKLADDSQPSWSADDARIAFDSRRGTNGNFEIVVMNANGSGQLEAVDPSVA